MQNETWFQLSLYTIDYIRAIRAREKQIVDTIIWYILLLYTLN